MKIEIEVHGVELSGTAEQLRDTLIKLGENPAKYLPNLYWSDSKKEHIDITAMNTMWLRNALLKAMEDQIKKLRTDSKTLDDSSFLTRLVSLGDHPILSQLSTELANRLTKITTTLIKGKR